MYVIYEHIFIIVIRDSPYIFPHQLQISMIFLLYDMISPRFSLDFPLFRWFPLDFPIFLSRQRSRRRPLRLEQLRTDAYGESDAGDAGETRELSVQGWWLMSGEWFR